MVSEISLMTYEQIIEYLHKKNVNNPNPIFLTYSDACAIFKHKDFDSFEDELKYQALVTVS